MKNKPPIKIPRPTYRHCIAELLLVMQGHGSFLAIDLVVIRCDNDPSSRVTN